MRSAKQANRTRSIMTSSKTVQKTESARPEENDGVAIDRLLRLPEVLRLVSVSRSAWWSGISIGIYPRPVRIGVRSVAWRYRDIKPLLDCGVGDQA